MIYLFSSVSVFRSSNHQSSLLAVEYVWHAWILKRNPAGLYLCGTCLLLQPLAKELGIKVVPTFKILKGGKVVKEVTGAKIEELAHAIDTVKSGWSEDKQNGLKVKQDRSMCVNELAYVMHVTSVDCEWMSPPHCTAPFVGVDTHQTCMQKTSYSSSSAYDVSIDRSSRPGKYTINHSYGWSAASSL